MITATTWGPDGRPETITSGDRRTVCTWDGLGRPTGQRSGDRSAGYRHDPRGLLREVTDPCGGVTRFDYDEAGRTVAVTDAKGARWETERDALGRPVAWIDPLGRRRQVELDAAGKVVGIVDPDGITSTFRWDPDGNLDAMAIDGTATLRVERDQDGSWVAVTDRAGSRCVYELDLNDRPTSLERNRRRSSWTYEDDMITASLPDGTSSRIIIDGSGRAVGVQRDGMAPVRIERDAAGRVAAVDADGLRRQWSRVPGGTVVSYREEVGGTIRSFAIGYDDQGQVVSVTGDATRRFAYDIAGQLVGEDGDRGTWRWDYDIVGRLVAEHGPDGERHFGYDRADQLTTIDDGRTVTRIDFDSNGRRIAEHAAGGDTRYRWDALGRLTAVESDGARATTLSYDPLATPSVINGQPVDWLDAGPLGPVPATIGDHRVVDLPGLPLAAGAGGLRWLAADWRGSVDDDSTWGHDVGHDVALGYRGELRVGGLVWLRNRAYDPSTHSFLSPDPLVGDVGWPGGSTNVYAYAHNSPLSWLDPAGLKPITADQANTQMAAYKQDHWKTILTVAMAVGAVVLVATNPELLVPALIGMAAGGGSSAVASKLSTGHVDWGDVAFNAAAGGLIGAAAPAFAPASKLARVAVGAGYGGSTAAATSATDDLVSGRPFNPAGDALSGVFGAVPGGALHSVHWTETLPGNKGAQFSRYIANKGTRDPSDPSTLNKYCQKTMAAGQVAAKGQTDLNTRIALPLGPAANINIPALVPAGPQGCPPRPPGFIGPIACP